MKLRVHKRYSVLMKATKVYIRVVNIYFLHFTHFLASKSLATCIREM